MAINIVKILKLVARRRTNLCTTCKGAKMLCGKQRCPLLLKYYAMLANKPLYTKREIFGSSPPEIFVGRVGYPKVFIGPMIPPIHGRTEIFALTEFWFGKSIQEIIDMRFKLIRGKERAKVTDVEKSKVARELKNLVLCKKSVDAEIEFKKIPRGFVVGVTQPFGPSAPIKKIRVYPSSTDFRVEKVYCDHDLNASDAIIWLYQKGTLISKIQQVLSAGLIGVVKSRRFVPTRWSITAVDDIISKNLVKLIKQFPLLNEYRVYCGEYLDNRWIVLMIPDYWSYECVEAWYPGTSWNPSGEMAVGGDYESYEGRKSYASIGGCYYAARLSVTEKLVTEKRQATVLVLREIHPGYLLPVGVWQVREAIRNTLKRKPIIFSQFNEVLNFINGKLSIPLGVWIKNSKVLKKFIYQKRLVDFNK